MPIIGVVEDNPDNRLLVRAILEDIYEIVEFEAGREALEAFRAAPPDLVLLDISLPGMDGTEVLRHMRDDTRLATVPVIALTAHAMTGDRERYLAEGFDDYLSKPIVEEEVLMDAIVRLLSRGRERGGGEGDRRSAEP